MVSTYIGLSELATVGVVSRADKVATALSSAAQLLLVADCCLLSMATQLFSFPSRLCPRAPQGSFAFSTESIQKFRAACVSLTL